MDIDNKINRVIASCKTKEQIICASKFMILAAEMRKITVTRARYWQGVINGICYVNHWK
jgi:hypothetical protein|tara:strand:+ start:462 stop:638 length:177 start_codon:yes stop_codon:yes gene_type:complete